MDLFALAATLTLDTDQYLSALADAEAGLDGFTARVREGLRTAEQLSASVVGDAPGWGRDMIQGFTDGMLQRAPALRAAVAGIAQTVRSYLHFSEPDEGPLSDFHTYAPDMMALFAEGIRDNAHLVTDQIGRSFDIAPSIAQAAAPASREFTVPRNGGSANDRPINVIFELEGAQQWIYRLNKAEEQRVGVRLSTGGVR